MAMSVTTGFDPEQHKEDGKGWINSWDDGTGQIATATFDTLTLAHAAAKTILSDDMTIHNTIYNQEALDYITANQATVNTNTSSERVVEGLDSAFPP